MDKSHKYRRPHHKSGQQNVDGFLSADGFKKPSGSIGFPDTKKKSKNTEVNQKIDDFNRPSGYHPNNSSLNADVKNAPLLPDGPRKPIDPKRHFGLTEPPKKK